QTASSLQKNKSNALDVPAPNKKTKISNEVSPLTIENIIDSIILTPSSKVDTNSNGNHSFKPSYVDTIRNNTSQTAANNVSVQNLSPPTKKTLPDQTSLNQIMDNLSKLKQKFKTLSDDLIATKNISKELQLGQLNLFMRVENIEQLCYIFPLDQQNNLK
ncbi:1314_t:CDS:2, partial [Funneliformis geosporum]